MRGYFASFRDKKSAESAIAEMGRRSGSTPAVRMLRSLGAITRDSTPASTRTWRRGMMVVMAFGAVTGAIFALVLYGIFTGNLLSGTAIAVAILGAGAGALYTGAAGAISGSVLQDESIQQLRHDHATGYTVMEIEVEDVESDILEAVLAEHAHLVAAP